ncbi:MAG: hypothetical protein AAFO69_00735 [Bacteroidota bacterium]
MKNRGSSEGKLEQLLKSYVAGYTHARTQKEKNEFADQYIVEMGKPGSYVTGRKSELTTSDVMMIQVGGRFDQFSKEDKIDFYSEMVESKIIPNVNTGKFADIMAPLTFWKTAYYNLLKTKANHRTRDNSLFSRIAPDDSGGDHQAERYGKPAEVFEFSKPFDFVHLQAVFFGLFFLPKKYNAALFEDYCVKLKYISDKVAVNKIMERRGLPAEQISAIKRSYKDNTTSPDYKASNLFNTSARQRGYDYQYGSVSERKAEKPLHGRSLIIRGILRHLFVDFQDDHRAIQLSEGQLSNLRSKINKPEIFDKEGKAQGNPMLAFDQLIYATYAVYHELVDVLKMEEESDLRGQSGFFESLKAELNHQEVQDEVFLTKLREVFKHITTIDI